jgi:hypothetical protein
MANVPSTRGDICRNDGLSAIPLALFKNLNNQFFVIIYMEKI